MTARSVLARVATAVAVLAGVVAIYLAVLLVTGADRQQRPPVGSLVLATTVVALVLQPLYRSLGVWFRRRLAVRDPPLDLLRRLPRSVAAQVPADELPAHLVRVLAQGLRARRAELWLVVQGHSQLAAAWPAGDPPSGLRAEVHPIRHSGVEVARLHLFDPAAGRRSTVEQRLLAAAANQAGEVLVMLARQQGLRRQEADLAEQTERLRVARAAAAAAERAERRRIERDLHDGAQQQVIALGLALQLARRTADQAPDRCRQTLSAAADLAHRTAQELGRLSWSLYSAVTTASDLGAALQAAADRLPIAMTVTAAPPQAGRDLGPQCRMALYFVVLEAAQNAIKHAAAWSIQVRIEQAGDELRVSVTDDGRGFDPGASTAGTGLRQAAIRLGEVGGRLQVTSRPGAGSMLTATVPAAVPGAVSSVTP